MDLKDKSEKFHRNHTWWESFQHALEGIFYVIQNEINFKRHLVMMGIALLMAYILKFTLLEWLLVLLVCAGVLVAEMLNSAIEAMVDLVVGSKLMPLAKLAKDMGAGAVLLMAFFALVIGCLLYIPKLIGLIN